MGNICCCCCSTRKETTTIVMDKRDDTKPKQMQTDYTKKDDETGSPQKMHNNFDTPQTPNNEQNQSEAQTYENENDSSTSPSHTDALPKQKSVYKSVKGDKVDEAVAKIFSKRDIQLPIYRIGEGKYLIGTDSRMCMIKGTSIVVRVGGGFESLEDYLIRNEQSEIDKIHKTMEDQQKTYAEVVKDLLDKYKTEKALQTVIMKQLQKQAILVALNQKRNSEVEKQGHE